MLTRKFESIGCGVCAERVFAGISYSLSPGWGVSTHAQLLNSAAGCWSNCPGVVQYTPLIGVGGVAAHIHPPWHTAWCYAWVRTGFLASCGNCIRFQLLQWPAASSLLWWVTSCCWRRILAVGCRVRALFWARPDLPSDDSFWFSGKCVVSSPNVLKCFLCQSLMGAVDPDVIGNSSYSAPCAF